MKFTSKAIDYKCTFCILLLFIFVSSSYSQKQEIREIKPFSQVYVKDRIAAILTSDTISKVVLVPNGNAWIEEVNVKSNGKELAISSEGKFRDSEMMCYVHYQQPITYLDTQNGGIIRTDSGEVFTSKKLEISASNNGFINLNINVDELIIHAGSGCDLYIQGNAKNVKVYGTTGAKVHMDDLECENAEASSVLGAKIWLTVKNDYTAKAGSGGKIYYYANPTGKFDRNRTTGGDVELILR